MQHNILMYQIMIEIIKSWLRAGKISKADYKKMNTRMVEKYGISLSGILIDNSVN